MISNRQFASQLSVRDLSVTYGATVAVGGIDLTLGKAEIGAVLGPSGCGKSTLLRAIAGLENLAAGQIEIGGSVLSSVDRIVPAEERGVGMVFQDIALFPHLTIAQNVAFGLNGHSQQARARRLEDMLRLVGLAELADRYPEALSGGQQQRAALARALAPKPAILLLDEPFSGLDTAMKEKLVPEVRAILRQENITALVVTHDQLEAFTLADKIALMNNGKIEQMATPYALYHQPATRFVADFIGQGYFIPARVLSSSQIDTDLGVLQLQQHTEHPAGTQVDLLLRPDDVLHDDDSPITATIEQKLFKGPYFQYEVRLTNGRSLLCIAPSHHDHAVGQQIGIRIDLDHSVLFPAVTT